MPSFLRFIAALLLSWAGLTHAQTMSITTRTAGVLFDSSMPSLFESSTLADGVSYTLDVTSKFDIADIVVDAPRDSEIDGAEIDVVFRIGGQTYHFSGTGWLGLFKMSGPDWSPTSFFSGSVGLPMPEFQNSTLYFAHSFELPNIYYPAEGPLAPVTLNNPWTIAREVSIFMRDGDGNEIGLISGVPTSLYYEITAPAQVTSPVPEPGGWMLLMAGLAVVAASAMLRGPRVRFAPCLFRRATGYTATLVLSTASLAAAAAPVTVTTSSSGILYSSTMPQVFGDTQFVDGGAYELSLQATFDTVPHVYEQFEQVNAENAEIVAIFTYAGVTHRLVGTGESSIFFSRGAGFDRNRTILSVGASFVYDPIANTRIAFVHNFELSSAFYPAAHVLDAVDIDTQLTTKQEATITLLTLDHGQQLGRIHGIPASLAYTVSPVPEPATPSMLLVGVVCTLAMVRRRRSVAQPG